MDARVWGAGVRRFCSAEEGGEPSDSIRRLTALSSEQAGLGPGGCRAQADLAAQAHAAAWARGRRAHAGRPGACWAAVACCRRPKREMRAQRARVWASGRFLVRAV